MTKKQSLESVAAVHEDELQEAYNECIATLDKAGVPDSERQASVFIIGYMRGKLAGVKKSTKKPKGKK